MMAALDSVLDELADKIVIRLAQRNITDAGLTGEAPETQSNAPAPPDPWSSTGAPAPSVPPPNVGPSTGAFVPPPPPPAPADAYPAAGQPVTKTIETKNGLQVVTLNAPGAPQCKHGTPAAYVQGNTNGKAWKAWRCPLASTDQWKNKCDFQQWA